MKLSVFGSFAHLNVRPEEANDKGNVGAIDISFETLLKSELFQQIIPKDQADLLNAAFMKTPENPSFVMCTKKIALVDEVEHKHLRINFDCDLDDGITLVDFKLNKVIIDATQPGDNLYQIKFRLQGNPHKGDIDKLLTLVGTSVKLEVESLSDDMFEDEDEAA